MAVAYDTVSAGGFTAATTSPVLTFSHTCTGTNLVLIAIPNSGSATVGDDNISGVTYNGVAMTRFEYKDVITNCGSLYAYYLINPATGAHDVVMTGVTRGANYRIYGRAVSYTGVDQTSPIDAHTNNSQLATNTFNTSLSSVNDNCWHVEASISANNTQSAGTGTTQRGDSSASGIGVYDANSAKTPAGSVTLQQTDTGTPNWISIMFTLTPPIVSKTKNLAALGVG